MAECRMPNSKCQRNIEFCLAIAGWTLAQWEVNFIVKQTTTAEQTMKRPRLKAEGSKQMVGWCLMPLGWWLLVTGLWILEYWLLYTGYRIPLDAHNSPRVATFDRQWLAAISAKWSVTSRLRKVVSHIRVHQGRMCAKSQLYFAAPSPWAAFTFRTCWPKGFLNIYW